MEVYSVRSGTSFEVSLGVGAVDVAQATSNADNVPPGFSTCGPVELGLGIGGFLRPNLAPTVRLTLLAFRNKDDGEIDTLGFFGPSLPPSVLLGYQRL